MLILNKEFMKIGSREAYGWYEQLIIYSIAFHSRRINRRINIRKIIYYSLLIFLGKFYIAH